MPANRLATTVIFLGICATGLSSCGRRGELLHPEGGAYPRFFPGGIPREEWNKDDYIVKSEEEEKDKEKAFLERGDAPKPIKREDVGELE